MMKNWLTPRVLAAIVFTVLLTSCSAREDVGVSVEDPLEEPVTEDCTSAPADCDVEPLETSP